PAPEDPPELGGGVTLRPVTEDDINDLIRCFMEAFRGVEPFATLAEQARAEAARQCLGRTFRGGDGPWVRQASFAAVGGGRIVGTALLSLLPDGDPCDQASYYWDGPPPEDWLARRLGRPHLTWIFVAPVWGGHGVGTALLAAAARELLALGYRQL